MESFLFFFFFNYIVHWAATQQNAKPKTETRAAYFGHSNIKVELLWAPQNHFGNAFVWTDLQMNAHGPQELVSGVTRQEGHKDMLEKHKAGSS